MHGDHHGLWIDPANPSMLYSANDGGVLSCRATRGKTWKFAVTAGGAQFYNVELDTSTPFWAYGSIQDIGSRRGQIDLSKGADALQPVAFDNAPGGEGSNHAIDPTNPNIVYSHGFYGNFTRTDLLAASRGRGGAGAAARRSIQPDGSRRPELRAQWMAPIHHLAARRHDGLRGISVRCSDRAIAATTGRRSAPT